MYTKKNRFVYTRTREINTSQRIESKKEERKETRLLCMEYRANIALCD